ncbi:MAG: MarR family transcriptional regulator [archaeon]|nr:MarR family transcriptional regulator [archaeon]
MSDDDPLLLRNQLCFPLYACSRQVIRGYTPLLEKLDLTYTQYVVLMVLWEEGSVNVKTLGERLFLDSGTLSPLLKGMEKKGFIVRERSEEDSRVVIVSVTDKGNGLRSDAEKIHSDMASCLPLDKEEAATLYRLLYKILGRSL